MAKANGASRKGKGNLFSFSTMMKIPATLGTLRTFADALNLKAAEHDVQHDLGRKVVIVGPTNAGKSTLFNKIQGRYRSRVSDVPGTTQGFVRGDFGPFTLIDTPGHLPDLQESGARDAAVILFLIDGSRELSDADRKLFQRLQDLKRPLIVAMNKSDAVRGNPEVQAERDAALLGIADVIPISAVTGKNIASDLMPALIEASPEAALAIGRELPAFRREAAERLIRNAALVSLAAGLEPIPLIDIPIILGNQIRLVLRLSALYGEPLNGQNVRELVAAIAGGLAFRYLAEEAAKAVPFGGDLVSGAIAAAGTWAIGWVALEYFESGKALSVMQMRSAFNKLYARMRDDQKAGVTPRAVQAPQRIHIERDNESLGDR